VALFVCTVTLPDDVEPAVVLLPLAVVETEVPVTAGVPVTEAAGRLGTVDGTGATATGATGMGSDTGAGRLVTGDGAVTAGARTGAGRGAGAADWGAGATAVVPVSEDTVWFTVPVTVLTVWPSRPVTPPRSDDPEVCPAVEVVDESVEGEGFAVPVSAEAAAWPMPYRPQAKTVPRRARRAFLFTAILLNDHRGSATMRGVGRICPPRDGRRFP